MHIVRPLPEFQKFIHVLFRKHLPRFFVQPIHKRIDLGDGIEYRRRFLKRKARIHLNQIVIAGVIRRLGVLREFGRTGARAFHEDVAFHLQSRCQRLGDFRRRDNTNKAIAAFTFDKPAREEILLHFNLLRELSLLDGKHRHVQAATRNRRSARLAIVGQSHLVRFAEQVRHDIQFTVHFLPVPAFPGTLQLVDCEVQLADIPRFDFALFHFYRPYISSS